MHPSLMYELPSPSTAVVDRRQHVRFYPSSASSLSLTGRRTFRVRIGGEEFIDPSSIRLQYTIQADDGTKALQPLTGPWGCWSQMFCRSNGVELDNLPNYNRFHQQYGFNQLTKAEQFGSVGVEGFHEITACKIRTLRNRGDVGRRGRMDLQASGFDRGGRVHPEIYYQRLPNRGKCVRFG